MHLIVDLRDHEDKSHKIIKLKFEDEASIEHLQDKISAKFFIADENQQITDKTGRRIDLLTGSFESAGIRDNEYFVVKHSLLDTWMTYVSSYETVTNTKRERSDRTESAHHALIVSNNLKNAGFFTTYAKFFNYWNDTKGQMRRFVDRTQIAFEESAREFFSNKYPNSEIGFAPKKGGTRAGIVVKVNCNDEEIKYYMKTYHLTGSSIYSQTITKRFLPDFREMFAYRLLEQIGVGPVVYFPYYSESTCFHYIATKEVCEFKELNNIEDLNMQKQIVVRAWLLWLILGIRDLNDGNIGVNKQNSLSIIDFYVLHSDNFIRRDIFDDFKNGSFGGIGKEDKVLAEIDHHERIKIAKNALPHWNAINSLTIDIIVNEKNTLREHGIEFGIGTKDVNKYLQDIKLNYASICSALQ